MNIIFAAGGTAGHINVAVALAEQLTVIYNANILFIGSKKDIEKKMNLCHRYPTKTIDVIGFNRKKILTNFKTIKKLIVALNQSKKIIKNFKPDIVIGTGAYISAPVIIAAKILKIPTLIHESNSIPGFATKILSKFSDITCLGFNETKKFLNKKNVKFTGNPIRNSLLVSNKKLARQELNLDERPFVLAFAGSLGSSNFSKTICEFLLENKKNYQFMLSVGKNNNIVTLKSFLKTKGLDLNKYENIKILEYIDDMDTAFNAADLIIARSGACTISELIALKKPSILIPSSNVTNNHQEYNAKILSDKKCAIMILDKNFSKQNLKNTMDELFTFEKIKILEDNIRKINYIDANKKILNEINKLIKNKST